MERAILSQRIESILNEITRLSNTLYAMDNTNIERHSDNYEMLSTEAALRGEVIACRLRHLIYETTSIRKAEYLASAGVMQGISVMNEDGILEITLPCLTLKEVVPVDIETIGLNIRKCRNAKKMRQEDLAQKANVSSNYISAVERGVKIPSVETLIDIMNALGVSADMIFCDVIDAGVTEKNNQLDAKVSQLSTKDRKTVYDVLDLLVRDLSK